MKANILDYSLFDDGSLECKTWCLANVDDSWITSFEALKAKYGP